MRPRQLVGAVRQDDQNRIIAEPTGEIREQLERGWIGEVNVVNGEDKRLRTSQVREKHRE
jgi:hypothetical protein